MPSDDDVRYFDAYKRQFIMDELMPTLDAFAKKMGIVDRGKFVSYARRRDWEFDRQKYMEELNDVVRQRMLNMQSYDITQKLREIQAMKSRAWDGAMNEAFKTADSAISSYERLEKLERLLMGQSTENLTIGDLDNYMVFVAKILREELEAENPEAFERVRSRLSALTLDEARKQSREMN